MSQKSDVSHPRTGTVSRRMALKLAATGAAALSFTAGLTAGLARAAWAAFLKSFPTRTVEREEFSFDPATGMLHERSQEDRPYKLLVGGLVEAPLELDYAALKELPRTEQVNDFHCVEGWSVGQVHWAGFTPQALLAQAGPKPEAVWMVLHSLGSTSYEPDGLDHYVECLPLADLLDPELEYLFALQLDGEPLSQDRGAPLRLVTPYDLAYKSIKFVERVELTTEPEPGWWTRANSIYPLYAPVPARRLRDEQGPERVPYSERKEKGES